MGYAPATPAALPGTERLASRSLLLPTGTTVSPEDTGEICTRLAHAVAQSEAVREALGRTVG